MRVQFDYTSNTCIGLHVYNGEKQVLFSKDFARNNFAGTGIRTRYLPTQVVFIAAVTFHTGFSASSCVPNMVGH